MTNLPTSVHILHHTLTNSIISVRNDPFLCIILDSIDDISTTQSKPVELKQSQLPSFPSLPALNTAIM